MSEKAHWMPWYCREWLVDTRHLTCECRGAYRDLLDHQWLDGGLVDDQDELQRRAGATDREWKRIWPKIERYLPVDADGMRRNAKLERVRVKHLGRSRNGAKGGGNHASETTSKQTSKSTSKSPANSPALDVRVQTSELETTPAASARVAALVNRLVGHPGRMVVQDLFAGLPSGKSPDPWAAAMLGYLEGMGTPEGRACTLDQLVTACQEWLMLSTEERGAWNPRHFAAFVKAAMRGESRVGGRPVVDAIVEALNKPTSEAA